MTLLRRESYCIIEKLNRDGIDTRLVVLEASWQTVHDRILARGEEEGCWCMENIELARAGSATLPGMQIQTDGKPVEELCDEIARNGFRKILIANFHGGNVPMLEFLMQYFTYKKTDYAVMWTWALDERMMEAETIYPYFLEHRAEYPCCHAHCPPIL